MKLGSNTKLIHYFCYPPKVADCFFNHLFTAAADRSDWVRTNRTPSGVEGIGNETFRQTLTDSRWYFIEPESLDVLKFGLNTNTKVL